MKIYKIAKQVFLELGNLETEKYSCPKHIFRNQTETENLLKSFEFWN